jgi:membrane-associated phospholipid phosphatase
MTTVALAIVASMLAPHAAPEKTSADHASFGRVIGRHLKDDFRGMISPPSLFILGTGAAVSVAVRPSDRDVSRSFAASDAVERALEPGNGIGDGRVQVAVAAGAWLVGRVSHHPRLAATGGDLLEAQLLNGALTQALKYAVDRDRPDGGARSFPSGHTSAAFVTAAVIQQRYGWKAGIPAYALGAYVGAARVGEQEHYLSDVVFAAALGTVVGRAVSLAHNPRVRLSAAVIPTRGGFAVVFAR